MRPILCTLALAALSFGQGFTLEQITSYPFPNELTAAATGTHIAWAANERGKRNLYGAEGPSYTPRKLTNYTIDDGQELTSVTLSTDGKYVVYVRGGDHGANWDPGLPVNPTFSPTPPKVQVWSIPFDGGSEPKLLGEGDHPAVGPTQVAFLRAGQTWIAPIDGSKPAKALFNTRGTVSELAWSPDGSRLAFTAHRGDHSFIGVYRDAGAPLTWLAASFTHDRSPRWSPDGKSIAFVRMPGSGGAPQAMLTQHPAPWSIWAANADGSAAHEIRKAPSTLRGSVPSTQGGTNLNWAAGGRITFLSYQDGWPHLYSIDQNGGTPVLLTPGKFMAEYITLSSDGKWLLFAGNTGPDALDLDRRHIVRVGVDKPGIEVLTAGDGIESSPVVTGDGSTVAFLSATPSRPAVLAVQPSAGGPMTLPGLQMIPSDFPTAEQMVVPKQVIYKSLDGLAIHAQLFERAGGPAKKPAIVFVHGGPPRQMLLGWHYGDYYANSYAMNQYLASRGFVVLSVNYRLGIGYGYEFHRPPNSGTQGASEYLDVKAGGEWLAKQPQVDAARIGIYGGSYGGFLTAMALGKDSKLFAAGVDIHGVHDRTLSRISDGYEKAPDAVQAADVAYRSSPIAYVNGWKSPTLFIHGDDDRNVRFNQTTDLLRRLDALKTSYESLVIVDDTHHFMRHGNQLHVDEATAEFLERKLKPQVSGSVSARE